MESDNEITVEFDITNQECAQSQCSTSLEVKGLTGLAVDKDETSWSVDTLNTGSGDYLPMYIKQAHLTATLVQGGQHVCLETELNIIFRANVPLKAAW